MKCYLILLASVLMLVAADVIAEEPQEDSTPTDVVVADEVLVPPASDTRAENESTQGSDAALPEEFQDSAFGRYVDLGLVRDSLAARDASLLADAALQLAEGERVLLRNHKSGLTSKKLLSKAVWLAGDIGDRSTLERLTKAVESTSDKEAAAEIQAAQKLVGVSRSTDPIFSMSLDSTDLETLTDVKGWLAMVQEASLLGDALGLRAMRELIEDAERLSDAQKTAIVKQIEEAIEAAGDADEEDAVLLKLAGPSRSDSDRQSVRDRIEGGGWYIVWGKTVAAGEYAGLVAAIATGNIGTYFTYLYEENVRKLKRQLPDLQERVIRDAVLRALKGRGVVRLGKFGIKGGIATYRYWHTITVDVPDGVEEYWITAGPSWARIKTKAWRPKMKRVTRTVPAEPNNHQPYFGFRVY